MEKLDPHSPDLTEQNIEKLAELFPAVITETRDEEGNVKRTVDFDLLGQELSDHVVEGPQERYQLDWPGKRQALFNANAPIAKTLRPVRDDSIDFDTTQNLFIEGDNLDALKLLQESYLGKVKLIYIDPPYNTGNDFVYDDDFATTTEEYLEESKQADTEGNRLVSNPESNGRFHSDWLSMMYSRIKLARKLLTDDGILFVSIDDNESAALKLILDEVFGARNFVATIVWEKVYSPMNSATQFASVHDYIHVYAQHASHWASNLLPRTAEQDKAYKNPDNDPRGNWKAADATAASGHATPAQFYELETPSGNRFSPPSGRAWLYTRPRYEEMVEDDRVWFGKDGQGRPAIKRFLSEVKPGRVAETLWPYKEVGHNQDAKKELLSRIDSPSGNRVFDTPKPTKLIRRMMQLATDPESNDIVMDFFAGSGTTADAVMQQNANDGGSRRFVLVQIAETTDSEASDRTEAFGNISELSRARITNAGREIMREHKFALGEFDVGFRTLRVDSTNFGEIPKVPDALFQETLLGEIGNAKGDRDAEDLLFECLIGWGLELSLPVRLEKLGGRGVLVVDDGALIACFEDSVDSGLVRKIAALEPLRVAFRDSSFESDADRINATQIFTEVSPSTEVKVI